MKTFEQLHPDIVKNHPECTSYRFKNESCTSTIEAWDKIDGVWVDVTAQVRKKERIEREIERHKKILRDAGYDMSEFEEDD